MKTYVINGFIVPVTEKDDQTIKDSLNQMVEATSIGDFDKVQSIEKSRKEFIYRLYKEAILGCKAKQVDSIFRIHDINL